MTRNGIIEPDCTGRRKLTEAQMMPVIQKIKKTGQLQQEPPNFEGRGIVIGGGGKYLAHAWAVARRCRNLRWREGIQVWHIGPEEIPEWSRQFFEDIDVELVDAQEMRKKHPIRILGGWEAKNYAVMHSPFRHVLWLDADCTPDFNPEEMFNHEDVRRHGSLFFSDIRDYAVQSWPWVYCSLVRTPEWEAGQYIVDKQRAWMGLRWAFFLNEHSDVWYRMVHGDKVTLQLGMQMSGCSHLVSNEAKWEDWGIGQYYKGKRWFSHQMASKRGECPWKPEFQEALDEWSALTIQYTSSPTRGPRSALVAL